MTWQLKCIWGVLEDGSHAPHSTTGSKGVLLVKGNRHCSCHDIIPPKLPKISSLSGCDNTFDIKWGGDRGGVEKNIHKKYFRILSITKIHKNSQKITKNHKKSQKCTVLGRCNCGVILLSNAQLCSVVFLPVVMPFWGIHTCVGKNNKTYILELFY